MKQVVECIQCTQNTRNIFGCSNGTHNAQHLMADTPNTSNLYANENTVSFAFVLSFFSRIAVDRNRSFNRSRCAVHSRIIQVLHSIFRHRFRSSWLIEWNRGEHTHTHTHSLISITPSCASTRTVFFSHSHS